MPAERHISHDDDFTVELIDRPDGKICFRLAIETSDPEKFARFREALDCAERILRLPDWRRFAAAMRAANAPPEGSG